MTRPLQTTCAAGAEDTALTANITDPAIIRRLSSIVELFCCVIGWERLQSLSPQHRHPILVLALEDRDRRIWTHGRINLRVENLRQIFGSFARLMLAHHCKAEDHK